MSGGRERKDVVALAGLLLGAVWMAAGFVEWIGKGGG